MTSDAKVGVLLGLVFIFVIAFVINGLPSLRGDKNNNDLTINGYSDNSSGIAQNQRSARDAFRQIQLAENHTAQTQAPADELRFEMPIPQSSQTERTVEISPPGYTPPPAVAQDSASERSKPAGPASPKVYVVSEDDNLAVIAKKFYGPEEGNRKVNVDRIFQANRSVLKLPDEIFVGQKLIIPPLSSSASGGKDDGILSSSLFEKVESIGRRHISDNGTPVKQSKIYVVQENDSLWRIAAKQLGDGSRYSEIARLNADILEHEDFVLVGMRLKMPPQ